MPSLRSPGIEPRRRPRSRRAGRPNRGRVAPRAPNLARAPHRPASRPRRRSRALCRRSLPPAPPTQHIDRGQASVNRTVHVDQQETHALADEWRACQIPVDLQIINSPYREAITPLLDYIRDIHISESAIRAEEETPGEPADAVVWEQLEQSAGEETRLSITYLCFMIVATMIAGIGVMLDQPILIVGAMVVGPEFGPLVALCIGIVTRRRQPAARALGTLVLGFAVGMAATVILTWIMTAFGLLSESMLIAERPLTSFIWQPDALSWIVGFLAGTAGMLALTSAKSGALVGVLISVTTIPAAANAAVAIACWVPSEAIGSAVQLVINLSAIAVAGTLTLLVLKARAEQLARRSPEHITQ